MLLESHAWYLMVQTISMPLISTNFFTFLDCMCMPIYEMWLDMPDNVATLVHALLHIHGIYHEGLQFHGCIHLFMVRDDHAYSFILDAYMCEL